MVMEKNKRPKKDNWGARLRSVLKEKQISLRRAADIAGVSPSVLDNWANGSSPEDLQAVKRLCNQIGISFSWLLTGERDVGAKDPSITEFYEEVPYFDGLARIRIDRLLPRKLKGGSNDET